MFISIRDCMVSGELFSSPVDGMRHLGIEAVEIELREDFSVLLMDSNERQIMASDQDAEAYGRHLCSLGLRPVSLLTAKDFSQGDTDAHAGWVARAMELAQLVGCGNIRIDVAMKREREMLFMERVDLFSNGLGAALERTSGISVTMGIENHGYQGNNLAFLLNVLQKVGNDRLGMTLDTGNFYWRGYPLSEVYGILRILAPYAKHTHLKNIHYPESIREEMREAGHEYGLYVSPLDEGDIDHFHVAQILHDAGYDGDLCIEDESLHKCQDFEKRVEILERDTAHVKECIGNLG